MSRFRSEIRGDHPGIRVRLVRSSVGVEFPYAPESRLLTDMLVEL